MSEMNYSIDERSVVTVGSVPQHIRIRGTNPANPVLLFLHGGPGVCDRHWVLENQSRLAELCTLVCWDQRGAGLSYDGRRAKHEHLTIGGMVEDAHEVVETLCRRFGQEKIYVVGHSWGSILGVLLAQRYPEHLAAYVGMGQFADGSENERLSYEFVLHEAERRGDKKALRELGRIGAPVQGRYRSMDDMMVQRNYMNKYGGEEHGKGGSIYAAVVLPLLRSPEYGLRCLYRYARGSFYSLRELWDEVVSQNFLASVPRLELPVFITQGRHDQNTPPEIAHRWFDALDAPQKEWIWFENSGHSPIKEEPVLWGDTLASRLFGKPLGGS